MDVIFTVSPDYLKPMLEISREYDSFYIQGYPTFSSANVGLHKTNISDIIGFLIVVEDFGENLNDAIYFFESLLLIEPKVPILFSVNDREGLFEILRGHDLEGLKVQYLNMSEIVTDRFIRRNLFGTILKDCRKPYRYAFKKEDIKKEPIPITTLPSQKFSANLSRLKIITLERATMSMSLAHTKIIDTNLKQLEEVPILYNIRLLYLHEIYGENTMYIRERIDTLIKELKTPKERMEYTILKHSAISRGRTERRFKEGHE